MAGRRGALAALAALVAVSLVGETAAQPGEVRSESTAIAAEIRAIEAAAVSAAFASAVGGDANLALAFDRNRTRAAELAVTEAVVAAIARSPSAAPDIVRAAVAAAPAYRAAIVAGAGAAYPGFAARIAVAAGGSTLPPAAVRPAAGAPARQRPRAVASGAPAPGARAPGAREGGETERERTNPFILDLDYLASYPLNAGRLIASPWRFERSDWINTAVVVAVSGGLIALDASIRDFVQDDVRGDTSDAISDVFREFGDLRTVTLSLGAAYLGGELIGDWRLQETALLAGETVVLAGYLGRGLKWLTQRERPSSGQSPLSWEPFAFDDSAKSFPSGHTILAFSVASVVSSQYEDVALVPPVAYTIAALAGWSRMNDNKHWASDVFAGAAIGYFVGKMVVRYSPFRGRPVALVPMTKSGAPGLTLAYRF